MSSKAKKNASPDTQMNIIAPLGGLPSRVPQILIDLVCCLFVARFMNFFRMVSASVTHADTIRSFETGSKKRSGASGELGRTGPKVGSRKFATLFQKKFDQKTNRLMMPCVHKTRLIEA